MWEPQKRGFPRHTSMTRVPHTRVPALIKYLISTNPRYAPDQSSPALPLATDVFRVPRVLSHSIPGRTRKRKSRRKSRGPVRTRSDWIMHDDGMDGRRLRLAHPENVLYVRGHARGHAAYINIVRKTRCGRFGLFKRKKAQRSATSWFFAQFADPSRTYRITTEHIQTERVNQRLSPAIRKPVNASCSPLLFLYVFLLLPYGIRTDPSHKLKPFDEIHFIWTSLWNNFPTVVCFEFFTILISNTHTCLSLLSFSEMTSANAVHYSGRTRYY